MTATPTAVVVLALFVPLSCGPVTTSAGPPLAWGAAGNPLARRGARGAGRVGRPQARAPAGAGWQGVGGRGQVGLREKWLYLSYTLLAPPRRRPTLRTALMCHPERRGCLARAPRSQAEHGAAWRWLVLDRRRRMGEGSAQGCPGVKAAREADPTAGLTAV
jgi:hypothetical protein